ncbi:hypothetical protein [Cohnella sp. AR92]|uniref:hypothetical protein n=1 Tax=Cohnella sp. AR92 TaxID=648716 RepID=UPI000F8C6B05|nr:hypothetical protein [Cohnella sp. AR92]RUS47887.1 hypothetical protein ELR57_04930 [Cohnella sp. AR92]
MWEYLSARLLVLVVICFATLLVVISPMIGRYSKASAKFSLVMGGLVFVLLFYFLFSNPVIREQILRYGFK